MARKRKPKVIDVSELPTPEQLRNGSFERDFVTHVDSNTKAMTYKRRDSSIVARWCEDGGEGYDTGAQRVIADCVVLWTRLGTPQLVARYGERLAHSTHSNGATQEEALDTLHRYKSLLGPHMRHYWSVFENCIRHNEPAGVAGSAFAKTPAERIQSAKIIVGMVATFIAGKLGY